jgi:hypothetical protein
VPEICRAFSPVYASVSVTVIVPTLFLITTFVAPLISAARSEPGPSLFPFVTFAAGAAKAESGADIAKSPTASPVKIIFIGCFIIIPVFVKGMRNARHG